MGALIHRLRTGKGQYIEVPMFETMVAFVMPEHMAGRAFEPPMGEAGYARVINKDRRPFQTKDGWLCVLPYTTKQCLRFLRDRKSVVGVKRVPVRDDLGWRRD